jgi:hypothetical protein
MRACPLLTLAPNDHDLAGAEKWGGPAVEDRDSTDQQVSIVIHWRGGDDGVGPFDPRVCLLGSGAQSAISGATAALLLLRKNKRLAFC